MEKDRFQEFVVRHQKHGGKQKIRNSWGVYDYYKWYRRHKPKGKQYILKESQYFAIIRSVNKLLAEDILKCRIITLPERMGQLEIRKYDTSIRIGSNGEIVTNLPINWQQTLKLWYEDEESKRKKTLIRSEVREVFKLFYNKNIANYNNKGFYEFKFNKGLKHTLSCYIRQNLVDAPYFVNNNLLG